jgi:hypothetical protein
LFSIPPCIHRRKREKGAVMRGATLDMESLFLLDSFYDMPKEVEIQRKSNESERAGDKRKKGQPSKKVCVFAKGVEKHE